MTVSSQGGCWILKWQEVWKGRGPHSTLSSPFCRAWSRPPRQSPCFPKPPLVTPLRDLEGRCLPALASPHRSGFAGPCGNSGTTMLFPARQPGLPSFPLPLIAGRLVPIPASAEETGCLPQSWGVCVALSAPDPAVSLLSHLEVTYGPRTASISPASQRSCKSNALSCFLCAAGSLELSH